ncbi:uncharacterized protein BCR38DRAFT_476006 [Pseudomassariella vexata]|uniref:3-keto-steroid reductase n=1 Tax=Pseudomassariella vexata TaxID=1141098 RepID=A0A1Y2DPR9_9PEZI|nr:uncharacterized protein BCR38DRAFT_476006 [Pseudomassariella vexata]ORY61207.1 hypothetical protein BCR38DRAFT_476006 [Pseudomassariella vexata]
MASAPWEGAASHEQYFILLTGANSGVGLGIGQRLIDEFLATRSVSSHLILIPTTRSTTKSSETIHVLRAHLTKAVGSRNLRARPGYNAQSAINRIHLFSVELDLCKLPSVYEAAERLDRGDIRDPTGITAGGQPVAIPRLDAVLLNAGYGGWSGLSWLEFARQFFSVGMVQATTFPSFKVAIPSKALPPQEISTSEVQAKEDQPQLAEVFCANVFGHYILAHELLPLLSRSSPDETPARVVWTSSIDAEERHLDFDDFEALRSHGPYESSKRITDLISLTADLPRAQKASASFFTNPEVPKAIRPKFYLSHPGIVCTCLFPLNAVLFVGYYMAMYISRWLGSPWHVVNSYLGACATVWLALADQATLDAENAQHVKWGSSCDRLGRSAAKKTEVEGWGWEGKIEDAEALKQDDDAGILRKLKGRKWDAVELTDGKRKKFEDEAVGCWQELERLRVLWESVLGRDQSKAAGNRKA